MTVLPRFHPDHRWGNFLAWAHIWIIFGEKFMQNRFVVDNLKAPLLPTAEVGIRRFVLDYAYMALYEDAKAG